VDSLKSEVMEASSQEYERMLIQMKLEDELNEDEGVSIAVVTLMKDGV
jgi:hypothetical protein